MSQSHRQFSNKKPIIRHQGSLHSIQKGERHQRKLSVDTRMITALINKGKQYYHKKQMKNAIQSLSKAYIYNPNNMEVSYFLGIAYLTQHRYDEALIHLNQISKHRSLQQAKNVDLLMAIVYKKKHNDNASLQAITKGIEHGPSIEQYFFRAKLHFKSKDYERSIKDVDWILNKELDHLPSILLKVEACLALNQEQEALDHIDYSLLAVDEAKIATSLRIEKIKIFLKLDKLEEANTIIQFIENDLRIQNYSIFHLKGKLKQKQGLIGEAIIYWNQALSANADTKVVTQVLLQLCVHYMKERDFYEALSYLKRREYLKISSVLIQNLHVFVQGITFLMKRKHQQAIKILAGVNVNGFKAEKEYETFLVNLYYNSYAFGYFSLGKHQEAMNMYKNMRIEEEQTSNESKSYHFNVCLIEGILAYQQHKEELATQCFQCATDHINRPQPYFYIGFILNKKAIKENSSAQTFMNILTIINTGLNISEHSHMYYYRALIYMYLGMNGQALEDVDRAIEKSQDNIGSYFLTRGVIFMLDRNYEQALSQFSTCLSIDETCSQALLQKAKCQFLLGNEDQAYTDLEGCPQGAQWKLKFALYERNFDFVLQSDVKDKYITEMAYFSLGNFDKAGPSGKLVLAVSCGNYADVLKLLDEAIDLRVSVGSLETEDLLLLKGYSLYKMGQYVQAAECMIDVQLRLKQQNTHGNFTEQDERKLLISKINLILIYFKAGNLAEMKELLIALLNDVYEGPIYDELGKLSNFVEHAGEEATEITQTCFNIFQEYHMISDFLEEEEHQHLKYKILIPFPKIRIHEIEYPNPEQQLRKFEIENIDNKPQAPWIRRGEHGILFSNEIREYDNLRLETQESQCNKDKLKENLKLGSSVLKKLEKIANKDKDKEIDKEKDVDNSEGRVEGEDEEEDEDN